MAHQLIPLAGVGDGYRVSPVCVAVTLTTCEAANLVSIRLESFPASC